MFCLFLLVAAVLFGFEYSVVSRVFVVSKFTAVFAFEFISIYIIFVEFPNFC